MLGDMTVSEKMMNLMSKDSSVNLKAWHRAASSSEYTAESSGSQHTENLPSVTAAAATSFVAS